MAATSVVGARRATFSTSGLLPVLVLALLLHAPVASARHWFWNDDIFPVAPTQETTPAVAITAAQSEGASAEAAATPAPAAPAPPPAVSCSDAPVDPFIVSGAAPDPCAALAAELVSTGVEKLGNKTGGLGFAAPSLFKACYSTFLFRKECDVQDLLSIANGFDNHYVYKHIALDSPDQTNLPSSIDIVAELRKIVANGEAGKYARLVDAHMAARRATLALNDGHSMFDPHCFAGAFDLPLPLVAVVENGGQQIIRVAPRRYVPKGLDSVAKGLHGFDFALYEGRQVVAINGDKAEDFIRNWADKEVGFSRNLAARFTRSFARNVAATTPNGTMIVQSHYPMLTHLSLWLFPASSLLLPCFFPASSLLLPCFFPASSLLLPCFFPAICLLRFTPLVLVRASCVPSPPHTHPVCAAPPAILRDGASTENVEVPWIGMAKLADFANATGYWASHCAVPNPSAAATAGTGAQASMFGHADTPINDFLEGHSAPVYYDDTSDGSHTPDDLNVETASLSAAADGSSGAVAGPTVKRISPKKDFFLVYLVGGSTAVIWIHVFYPPVATRSFAEKLAAGTFMEEEISKALHTAAASCSLRMPLQSSPALRHSSQSSISHHLALSCPLLPSLALPPMPPPTLPSMPAFPVPLSSSNASQVIIDVRGNGGGSVQAAYRAVRVLMGAAKVPDAQLTPPMDFVIGTPYTENAMGVLAVDNTTAPHYYLGLYSDLNGTALSSAFDYAPFRHLRFTEGGRAGTYSAPFKFDHKGQLPVTDEQPVLGDRPFLVLSDGDCFSACAVLTHLLGKRHKVPMVTVGGLPNQPPDVSSSCLGFTLTDFYAMAEGLYKLAATDPQKGSMPLKVQGAVRMAFTNAYVDSEIPCEFEFLPSQHHVNYTVDLIAKPWAMWNEVAKLFGSAAA
ncbi:unnamed protein product [Closterium sp. Naga37s-1]|nr:unnamed protein product [Closterium sp. Naga37s-1]